MTIVNTICRITDWLNENVCTQVKFKVPPEGGKPVDDDYEYQEVCPHAFPLFLPTKDKLPPSISTNYPSICVQVTNGSDELTTQSRDLNISLGFSVWNPGVHSNDLYYPKGSRPDEPEDYRSGMDGWMDAWNLVDFTIRKLESATSINGIHISRNTPISFGPFKDQESIPDYYPFWFAWVTFSVSSDIVRFNQELEDLL